MIIPSEKLLGKVFGNQKITDLKMSTQTEIEYRVQDDRELSYKGIYELQHLLKVWALTKDYIIESNHGYNQSTATPVLGISGNVLRMDYIMADTEFEAVVLACEGMIKETIKCELS